MRQRTISRILIPYKLFGCAFISTTRILFFFIFHILVINTTHAQNETNNWFFGEYAGINFSSGSPVALTHSSLQTLEGCTAISSPEGELLFYTDGVSVWQKDHSIMPNGTDLMGHYSSTQSAIIVPRPNHPNLYYIFTVDAIENELENGLRYSLVDMSLDGGYGDIVDTIKNILLIAPVTEKITAVQNSSEDGIWVICHRWNTNIFHSYLVDDLGVNPDPVISMTGDVISGELPNAKGYLKVSPDGAKLAIANNSMHTIEIFDFNIETAEISNPIIDDRFQTWGERPYGIEFSPNSTKLYVSIWKLYPYLYQYDLTGSPEYILDSRTRIAETAFQFGALQLGPDERIYVAQFDNTYLGAILFPNMPDSLCNYTSEGVELAGRFSKYGLPPFIQSFFQIQADFTYNPACQGEPTHFYENISIEPDSVMWNFGDPGSGSHNYSNLLNPSHDYEESGNYLVTLTAYLEGQIDEASQIISVYSKPDIWLGNDTSICEGLNLVLAIDSGYASYLWQNGDTNRMILTDTAGIFWVDVTNNEGCTSRDTLVLSTNQLYHQVFDTSICERDSIMIGGKFISSPGTYFDSLLSIHLCDSVLEYNIVVHDTFLKEIEIELCSGDSLFVGGAWQKDNGVYLDTYESFHNCDSLVITTLNFQDTLKSYSTASICEGDSIKIFGQWQKMEGIYSDTLSSYSGCDSIAEVELKLNSNYLFNRDTIICEGDSLLFGSIWLSEPGMYEANFVSVFGCDSILTLFIGVDSVPRPNLGNDTILIENQELTLHLSFPNCTFLWQDGSTSMDYVVRSSGIYYVKVTCPCGTGTDTIRVEKTENQETVECELYLPNAFVPDGDYLQNTFKPITNDCEFSRYVLQIFNRWGQKVFETKNIDQGWDGSVNGKPVNTGVYIYRINYKTTETFTKNKELLGTVVLLK